MEKLNKEALFKSENFDPVQNFNLKIESLNLEKLQLIQKKLNFLCHDYDPYTPDEKSQEAINVMNEFYLDGYIDNPFLFTNYLLQLLDNLEQAIKTKLN